MAIVRFKCEFLKIENEQIKPPQNNSYGQNKLRETASCQFVC